MLAGGVHLGPVPLGHWYVVVTIASEALLLFVAAQAGFIDGPRVMANMAQDSLLARTASRALATGSPCRTACC